jgi:hypothetical protein
MAQNKYIIIREDLVQDPVTVITEGLLIGRLLECELLLNHPSVSRAQAGIKGRAGNYYLFGLRSSNPVNLNGKPVEENEALAPGDVLEVGPFILDIDRMDDALVIKVSLIIGVAAEIAFVSTPDLGTQKLVLPSSITGEGKRAPKAPRAAPLPGDKALDIFWDKRIREAGKMVRPSPLFPKSQRRSGKAQFNWMPTTDLVSHWPVSFFVWAVVIVGLLSGAAAFWYTSAFAPAPVSRVHATSQLQMSPAIANKANANACTTCHSFSGNMEGNCSACHTAEAFVATVIEPHAAAGIGCVACHAEHRGADFKPGESALATCTGCHNDANTATYNGRRVGTPHDGTFGYPVTEGKWIWKGLNGEEWSLKKISVERAAADTDEKWRSKQFHALHVQHVRTVPGLRGNTESELSCSSCHKTFNPIDRETPKSTCALCHNGRIEQGTNRVVIPADKPNCISCHVQHIKDKRHWNSSLLAARAEVKPWKS